MSNSTVGKTALEHVLESYEQEYLNFLTLSSLSENEESATLFIEEYESNLEP
jgi:hypothetical protein